MSTCQLLRTSRFHAEYGVPRGLDSTSYEAGPGDGRIGDRRDSLDPNPFLWRHEAPALKVARELMHRLECSSSMNQRWDSTHQTRAPNLEVPCTSCAIPRNIRGS